MIQDLNYFKTKDFYAALQLFFKGLNIPVNYIAEEPVPPQRKGRKRPQNQYFFEP